VQETLEYPLLSDLFSIDQLDKQGEALARLHELDRRPARDKLLARLAKNEKILKEAHALLSEGETAGLSLFPAGVWLLDNFFLIKEHILLAREHLPKRYSRELPRLRAGQSAGLPRVYEIVRDLISHVDGRVDEGNLRTIVSSYQRVTSLKLGELWAIPIMLRLALIENLARIAARIAASRRDCDIADYWAARMLETAHNDPKNIILDIADMVRASIPMSCAFVAELVRKLQSRNPALALALSWIEQRLMEQGQTIERQVHLDSQQQAINHIAISNSIGSLRLLATIDWKNFVEAMSRVESILRGDPAGVYPKMDFTTRDTYRHVIEKIARQARATEESVAAQAVALAARSERGTRTAHIGDYLIDRRRPALEHAIGLRRTIKNALNLTVKRAPLLFYLGSLLLITTGFTALALRGIQSAEAITLWVISLLMLLGFSQAVFALVNWVATMVIRPRLLPKMDFSTGIPRESCTLITVPAMLAGESAVAALLNKMEVCYLSNRAENLYFSVLTDFEDAASETMPGDAVLLDLARTGMKRLNDTYTRNGCQPFLFFHRPRVWNQRERRWMGYERKRGKLEVLNGFLRSQKPDEFLIEGDRAVAPNIKYVITLDTDTELPRDCALHLIESIAHPLNAPVYDSVKCRVVDGYAILQPRVVSSLPAIGASWYSRIFGSDSGIDPYTRAVSDVYQDLFREGSFIGKGIYDVDMFAKVLTDRLPENRILSHDLLEGTYCRSGLISDVQVVDEFPERYSEDHARRCRWIRGDWQIAAWLAHRVPGLNRKSVQNPISMLSRWKIFDNLRRSLVPAGMLLLIVMSWLFVAPSWLGVAAVATILLLPAIPGALLKAVQIPPRFPLYSHAQSVAGFVGQQLFQAFFAFAVLPFEAFSNLDAILRTCWRMLISRRMLLQWTVSGKARHEQGKGLLEYYRLMGAAPLFALSLSALFVIQGRPDAWPVLVVWFFSPLLPWWISRPLTPRPTRLSVKQFDFIKKIARKTWRYFETFAGPEDNWLPADNYQEVPREAVAHRTSPTNIGLMLLSNLGAYDLGYLCLGQLIDKTRKSLKSMEALTRFRGHFLNWYDTKTLQPLAPQYVSTVDSGNLAGYLLTLRTGLLDLRDRPIFQPREYEGLIDTLGVLEELIVPATDKNSEVAQRFSSLTSTLREFQQTPAGLEAAPASFREIIARIHELRSLTDVKSGSEVGWWFTAFEDQCIAWREELLFLAPWLATEFPPGIDPVLRQELDLNRTLGQMARLREDLPSFQVGIDKQHIPSDEPRGFDREWLVTLEQQVAQATNRARERIEQLEQMAGQCQDLADQDYDFLYDNSRHLLAIGYDVAKRRKDDSFYDLLASESRLGSFVGIAQGKLPMEHWFRLGRLITIRRGKTVLLSWGGSMFEYLMPRLVMPGYDHTLLGQTCKAVVDRQIDYGRKQGVPWGISESAENSTDASMNYQYRSFGVPDLGFKRDLADDLVIAPYASVLALMVKPRDACENMERLTADGYEGRYGFYEAVDFTPGRLSGDHTPALIRSFMAHHQGMSFVSIVNFIAGNPMTSRFESDPLFRTTTLLLQERVPKVSPFDLQTSEIFATRAILPGQEDVLRIFTTPQTTLPEVHLLSNGRYHVMVTNAGSGYSRWRDLAVTRWNEDPTMDNCGTFVYVNDLSIARQWSATFQPTCAEPKNYEAIFSLGRAEFRRRDGGLDSYTEIAVSPEDDIEHRRITLSNFTGKPRTIELTSYAEVVLVPPAADAAHPAFSNLFLQTEILPNRHAILCSRRPRSPEEVCPWMFHLFTVRGLEHYELSYETDRLAFIGRGLTPRNPAAMKTDGPLGAAEGSVLDPIVSIRCRLTLKAGEVVTVSFISGMAETRPQAEALIDKYQDRQLADRVFDLAVIHGKVVLGQLNATEADAQLYGKLASSILYAGQYRRADPAILLKNTRGQSSLWAYSISGDLPIVVLRIGDPSKIELAAKLIQAHAYWRLKGLAVDLVIWNEERTGYRQVFNEQIVGLIAAGPEASLYDKTGGVFVRHPDQMSDEDQALMLAAARVVFVDSGGSLSDQIQRPIRAEPPVPRLVASRDQRVLPTPENFRQDNLLFFNGWGGFTRDGREYIIRIEPSNPTPMPWVNVVANKQFGTVISQSGGYTWFENAHEFRLTPWYNDPVSDRSGEALYVRDENSGRFWSAMPQPAPGEGDYLNRHGFGYSVFEYSQYRLKSELWIYVDMEAPVKFWMLKVRNDSPARRRLSATGFLELVLGENRSKTQMHIRTGIDSKTGALLASNPFNTEFPGRVVFFEVNEDNRSICGDRAEFIGRNGSLADPAALHRVRLSGKVGVGLDPAAALQAYFELEPGQEKEIVFILGVGRDIEDARNLIQRFRGLQSAHEARDRVWHYWNRTLGALTIETPDPALNVMANGWLVYQTMAARLWARSGFYQSGGAFGFRDQLQDVMALAYTEPGLIREQLLLCASRQFSEGDVQHWWHPPQGRGVRTAISDDYLWLPFVMSDYVTKTGDSGVLDETIHFLESRPLNPGEESFYDLPVRAHEKVTLYEHCKRAILHALRFGRHGLPLMGSGDWNDGMNLVGVKGAGESVWLAFFLHAVLKQFIPLTRMRGDAAFSETCAEAAERLRQKIESEAWDGQWYLRAFFDDGVSLGSSQNEECKIDATVQSWSVLSGAGSPERSQQAMLSLARILIDPQNGLIKLLDPPFDKSALEPGYIKGYVPGVRENGGQYTHAAIWAIMAFAMMGESRRVKELLSMINPINHGSSREKIDRYLVEPYVMAADIYGSEPHTGRGGWTWYTGSASWMYRLIIEHVLGLHLKANTLTFSPCIPAEWEQCKIHYRFRETVYHCEFHQIKPGGEIRVTVDGVEQEDRSVAMRDDSHEHFVEIAPGAAVIR
jgi:cellobiose phosphorylase